MNGGPRSMRSSGSLMRALNMKLMREVWRQRGQMFSIAAVVAVAIMTVLTMRGAYESLAISQQVYYRQANFPEVWAQLQRAPESLSARIAAIPGVARVETRVSSVANLDIPDLDTPARGQFVSIPEHRRSMLSDVNIREGSYIGTGDNDALISEAFALANGLGPGDSLRAIINGNRRDLNISGIAIAPEHTYSVPPGSLFPDDKRYGIIWMSRDQLGPAFGLQGAFNEVLLTLTTGADEDQVITLLDRLLEPYGGLGAYPRADQPSHLLLQSELDSVESMGTVVPAVFLIVAAFLLNLVLGRMISIQRTEIAVLKAFGYTNLEVGLHYLLFALAAVFAGATFGILLGIYLGGQMVQLYGEYFAFPELKYTVKPTLILIAVGVSALAAGVGALGAVRRAVSLPPAEAMRPEPPASFEPGVFERLGVGRFLPSSGRMILRNVERQPMRSLFSVVGVAVSVAILVIGMAMFDGVDHMMELQFKLAQREDLNVSFNAPLSQSARYDLARIEGVTRVEPYRTLPIRIHVGHLQKEAAITGLQPDSRLRQIVTTTGNVQYLPPEGLVVSEMLASQLGIGTGDLIDVEILEGARKQTRVRVAGLVGDYVGVSIYGNLDAVHRLAGGERAINGAYLATDASARGQVSAVLKDMPAVASVASPQTMLENFEEQLAESLFISVFFILGFSAVISIAVIYNGARVSLSERGREMASLRVLGFTRTEVAVLLLGEQALTTLVAIPFGWWLGVGLAAAVAAGIASDTYRIPLIVSNQTYVIAAIITLAAALASGWIVRRRLDQMDLIEVLKTRE